MRIPLALGHETTGIERHIQDLKALFWDNAGPPNSPRATTVGRLAPLSPL